MTRIEDYRDINDLIRYRVAQSGGISEAEIMKLIMASSRDNARIPMQWNKEVHAGFSQCSPWLKVNENYTKINVSLQEKDPNYILNYYKQMIKLRKKTSTYIWSI
jgi:alpha-glucosidase